MFFWLFLVAASVVALATVLRLLEDAEEAFLPAILTLMLSMGAIMPWVEHASDLGDLRKSQHLVEVYSERVESLGSRLDKFNYPQSAMWNKDSPVASIVEALSDAESSLAKAKSRKAEAKIRIESRASGPFSGVVTMIGRK